jgi:4-hydroxy-tetrahydrodipicolinate reductase
MTDSPPTAVQYGVGPIGSRLVETAVDRGYEFVAAVDVDPEKVGEDLGTIAGIDPLGVEITDDADEALATGPDVVFNSTLSGLGDVRPQLEEAMAAGADVVSTCEELAYPWHANPDEAAAIDEAAKEYGQTVLGTGINPGFAMDALPSIVTGACRTVDRIYVERVQDAGTRRGPLQQKVGAGTDPDRFESEIAAKAGHVGLPESVAMLGAALGWSLDEITEDFEPVIAEEETETEFVTVEPGDVAGIHQVGKGFVDGEALIELDLKMYVGAPDPHDAVSIEGVPSLEYEVAGGFHGDVTTPAVAINVTPSVRDAEPGLATMLDVAPPTCESF